MDTTKKEFDLVVLIKFGVAHNGKFYVESNMEESALIALLENAIRSQLGTGLDNKAPNKDLEWFTIRIGYNLDDTFAITHDCGSSDLVIGILSKILLDRTGKEII